MEQTQSPYIKHLYVCIKQRDTGEDCCIDRNGEAIRDQLKAYVKASGLTGKVRISGSGCMDLCAKGANVMVYPGERWYSAVTLEDIGQLIERELKPLIAMGQSPSGTVPT